VLVEEYLPGREFTTAVLGTGAEASVLGSMEVEMLPHAGTDIYSYEMKEHCEKFVRYLPMPPGPLRQEAEALALAAYRLLECRDVGRVDIRCDREGRPSFLEINPLPGMHPTHSDLPMIATREGISYKELVGRIIHSARERIGRTP
jgi:D-alanine-D-alanine ligase